MSNLRMFFSWLIIAQFSLTPSWAANVNVSGQSGQDGRDGSSGGGAAGRSTPGTDAGRILVTLKADPNSPNTKIVITGDAYDPSNRGSGKVNVTIDPRTGEVLHLNARGGDGGSGGNGGRGRDGRNGSDGSDATEWSSGGDGTDGEDGGSGGDGSAGSNGGDAGEISVTLDEKDLDLILLVRKNIDGGQGGSNGQGGAGGSGGRGGDGGRSHSWTETEYDYETVTEYDSEGNATTHEELVSHTEEYTNPGGSDGRDGRDGRSGRDGAGPGAPGRPGSYNIRVLNQDGSVSFYKGPFNLALVSIKFEEGSLPGKVNDGIFEPGETVVITELTVRNSAPSDYLPTPGRPENAPFILINGNSDVKPLPTNGLQIPKSLKPGESYTFKGELLRFVIPDRPDATAPGHYSKTANLDHKAENPRVTQETYPNFNMSYAFTVQQPVLISEISLPTRSIAPGEMIPVSFDVKNISTADFGSDSANEREIYVIFRTGDKTDINASDLIFVNESGMQIPLEQGDKTVIAHLGQINSGENVQTIKGKIGFTQNATPHKKIELMAELYIQQLTNDQIMRKRQIELVLAD